MWKHYILKLFHVTSVNNFFVLLSIHPQWRIILEMLAWHATGPNQANFWHFTTDKSGFWWPHMNFLSPSYRHLFCVLYSIAQNLFKAFVLKHVVYSPTLPPKRPARPAQIHFNNNHMQTNYWGTIAVCSAVQNLEMQQNGSTRPLQPHADCARWLASSQN